MNLKALFIRYASLLLTLAVGVTDYALWQRELSSAIFYLLPIALAAWFGGTRWAVTTALFATAAWHVVDVLKHSYTIPAAPYWNTGVRLVFFVLSAVFVSHARYSLQRERELATVDGLTGVANSRRFYEELEREAGRLGRGGPPFCVGFLDLDGFKQVNDEQGHVAGDQLLRDVAAALRSDLRTSDVIARIGGDEFGIILQDTDEDGALSTLKRLRENLARVMDQSSRVMTCSIGAVVVRSMPRDQMELIRRADQLMYRVKRRGKNSIEIESYG